MDVIERTHNLSLQFDTICFFFLEFAAALWTSLVITKVCYAAQNWVTKIQSDIPLEYFSNSSHGRFTLLPETHVHDTYKYDVIIETGHGWDSGTTSRVCLIMYGTHGQSEKTELTCQEIDMFRRSSIDMVPISSPQHLGALTYLSIWHSNQVYEPSYYSRPQRYDQLLSLLLLLSNQCYNRQIGR